MTYETVSPQLIEHAVDQFRKHLTASFEKHGSESYASAHEGYGVVAEEVAELLDAIRENESHLVENESLDVAVSALWLYISSKFGKMNKR